MLRQLSGFQNRTNRISPKMRRGFTLVETMLALALLMIVAVIVSVGFMSAMKFSGDTTIYQGLANQNDGSANKILSRATPAPTGTGQITFTYISGYNGTTLAPMSVYLYPLNTTVSPDDPNSKNRHVFIYVSPSPAP